MDITPYVEQLRRDLQHAAEVGGEQGREVATRLLLALEPSARLVLMEALSQAAAEITADLPAGSIETRLAGRELDFVVDLPVGPPAPPTPPAPPGGDAETGADAELARVTLRLPEPVKKRAEELASKGGISLNTWLVGVVRQAAATGAPAGVFETRGQHRVTGWL